MTTYFGIDFETANGEPGSICEFGFAWKNGSGVVENLSYVVRLHAEAGRQEHTRIHGITQSQTDAGEPFEVVHKFLSRYARLEDVALVAHSSFDRKALLAACRMHGLEPLEFTWVDSLKTSRRAYPELKSHKLNSVAEHIGVELSHHAAGSDAAASLSIFLRDGDPEQDALNPPQTRKQRRSEWPPAPVADPEAFEIREGEISSPALMGLCVGVALGMIGGFLLGLLI